MAKLLRVLLPAVATLVACRTSNVVPVEGTGEPKATPAPPLRCGRWPAVVAAATWPAPLPPEAESTAHEVRGLTDAEVALVRPLFAESIDYAIVRVVHDRYTMFQPPGTYMTPDGSIYAPETLYRDDFAAADPFLQAVFVHEMTHVWQHQNGVDMVHAWMLTVEDTGGDYESAYPYALTAGRDLLDYGFEQQASIVQDYFLGCAHDQPPLRLTNPPGEAVTPEALYAGVLGPLLADPAYLRAATE